MHICIQLYLLYMVYIYSYCSYFSQLKGWKSRFAASPASTAGQCFLWSPYPNRQGPPLYRPQLHYRTMQDPAMVRRTAICGALAFFAKVAAFCILQSYEWFLKKLQLRGVPPGVVTSAIHATSPSKSLNQGLSCARTVPPIVWDAACCAGPGPSDIENFQIFSSYICGCVFFFGQVPRQT